MKHLATVLSVVALVLVGVLFYLFAHHTEQLKTISAHEQQRTTPNVFRIAYFDMDTLQTYYDGFKTAQLQLKAKENSMNMELAGLSKSYQKKVDDWRQKSNGMTQAEVEQAQQEYNKDQQDYQAHKQSREQELYKMSEDMKTRIRKDVEEFLKEYNKQRNYSFIFEYDPGSFIYYKDSVYNITPDLVEGLNAAYKKKN